MLKSPEPILVAALFPDIHKKLLTLLKGLSAKDWQKPTVCPGWSVKDVALHLLGGEIGNLSRRRDGHDVKSSLNTWEELVRYINDWNQNWVSAANRMSTRMLLDLLEHTGSQMCDYFQGLDPFASGGPISWVGPKPAPVWLDLAREYTERWHHQQHIRDAVGKPGLKQPKYFSPVIGSFVRALPRTFRETFAEENTCVAVTITGSSGGSWSILRNELNWDLYSGVPQQADAEVLLDQEIAWRLFTRSTSKEMAREQITIKGDMSLGLIVLDMVSIIA